MNVPVRDEYKPLPCDIDEFISVLVTCAKDITKWNRSIEVALLSELLTCPLTLLYAIEKLGTSFNKNLVVHVVGAAAFECTFLNKWEIILHCLPQLTHLDMVFIGPEVEKGLETTRELCVDCQEKGRVLSTHFQSGNLYHQYAISDNFIMPNIIVVYNCGLHEYVGTDADTWLPSLPFLVKFNQTPLILTSYTSDEACKDIERILDCRKNSLTVYLKCAKNPFASRRPYRDWGSENCDVFFQNNFITLVTPC
jgi:splicing suppressor protein 51